MDDDIKIEIDGPVSDSMRGQLTLFEDRFQELWNNWESLKKLGFKIGGAFQNREGGKIGGGGCGVERHRLKGFYLDFRFFFADREDTQFFKVVKLVEGLSGDKRVKAFMREQRIKWGEAGFLEDWHGLNADDLIRPLFNGNLFHGDQRFQEKLNGIRSAMSNDLAHHVLAVCIYNRMLVIRNLRLAFKPLLTNGQHLELPARYEE